MSSQAEQLVLQAEELAGEQTDQTVNQLVSHLLQQAVDKMKLDEAQREAELEVERKAMQLEIERARAAGLESQAEAAELRSQLSALQGHLAGGSEGELRSEAVSEGEQAGAEQAPEAGERRLVESLEAALAGKEEELRELRAELEGRQASADRAEARVQALEDTRGEGKEMAVRAVASAEHRHAQAMAAAEKRHAAAVADMEAEVSAKDAQLCGLGLTVQELKREVAILVDPCGGAAMSRPSEQTTWLRPGASQLECIELKQALNQARAEASTARKELAKLKQSAEVDQLCQMAQEKAKRHAVEATADIRIAELTGQVVELEKQLSTLTHEKQELQLCEQQLCEALQAGQAQMARTAELESAQLQAGQAQMDRANELETAQIAAAAADEELRAVRAELAAEEQELSAVRAKLGEQQARADQAVARVLVVESELSQTKQRSAAAEQQLGEEHAEAMAAVEAQHTQELAELQQRMKKLAASSVAMLGPSPETSESCSPDQSTAADEPSELELLRAQIMELEQQADCAASYQAGRGSALEDALAESEVRARELEKSLEQALCEARAGSDSTEKMTRDQVLLKARVIELEEELQQARDDQQMELPAPLPVTAPELCQDVLDGPAEASGSSATVGEADQMASRIEELERIGEEAMKAQAMRRIAQLLTARHVAILLAVSAKHEQRRRVGCALHSFARNVWQHKQSLSKVPQVIERDLKTSRGYCAPEHPRDIELQQLRDELHAAQTKLKQLHADEKAASKRADEMARELQLNEASQAHAEARALLQEEATKVLKHSQQEVNRLTAELETCQQELAQKNSVDRASSSIKPIEPVQEPAPMQAMQEPVTSKGLHRAADSAVLEAAVALKDTQITELKARISMMEASYKDLSGLMVDAESTAAELSQDFHDMQQRTSHEISELEALLMDKDSEIWRLGAKLVELEEVVPATSTQATPASPDSLQPDTQQLRDELVACEAKLLQQQAENKASTDRIAEVEQELRLAQRPSQGECNSLLQLEGSAADLQQSQQSLAQQLRSLESHAAVMREEYGTTLKGFESAMYEARAWLQEEATKVPSLRLRSLTAELEACQHELAQKNSVLFDQIAERHLLQREIGLTVSMGTKVIKRLRGLHEGSKSPGLRQSFRAAALAGESQLQEQAAELASLRAELVNEAEAVDLMVQQLRREKSAQMAELRRGVEENVKETASHLEVMVQALSTADETKAVMESRLEEQDQQLSLLHTQLKGAEHAGRLMQAKISELEVQRVSSLRELERASSTRRQQQGEIEQLKTRSSKLAKSSRAILSLKDISVDSPSKIMQAMASVASHVQVAGVRYLLSVTFNSLRANWQRAGAEHIMNNLMWDEHNPAPPVAHETSALESLQSQHTQPREEAAASKTISDFKKKINSLKSHLAASKG